LKYDWCSYASVSKVRREELYDALLPESKDERHKLAEEYRVLEYRRYAPASERQPTDDARRKEIQTELDHLHASVAKEKRDAIELRLFQEPYEVMRSSLNKVDRDIVYSLCQYGMGDSYKWAAGPAVGGNLWRTTGDISPRWDSMTNIGFNQIAQQPAAGPGHWNDPDMLEVGNGTLTAEEQYTHITLWSMLAAPLLIGTDLTKLTPFGMNTLTNDEVIAVDQDPLGVQAKRISKDGGLEVWARPLADGSTAVALFNRGTSSAEVVAKFDELGLHGKQAVRDLWRQKDVDAVSHEVKATVLPHSAEMFKLSAIH
jgi:alpha-galactosidase